MNLLLARKYLKLSFLCGAITVLGIPGLGIGMLPFNGLIALYIVGFVLLHVLLGLSARAGTRSWVYFGLLPVLVPLIGWLISATILYFSLRKFARADEAIVKRRVSVWPVTATLACLAIIGLTVPLAGHRMENWQPSLMVVYVAAVFCLPVFSLVGVFQSLALLQDGQRNPETYISLVISALGLAALIALIAMVTGAP